MNRVIVFTFCFSKTGSIVKRIVRMGDRPEWR
jgi:hypothetical protein